LALIGSSGNKLCAFKPITLKSSGLGPDFGAVAFEKKGGGQTRDENGRQTDHKHTKLAN
jgi:hypothetical protein